MLVFGIVLAILGTVLGMPETRSRLQIDFGEQGKLLLYLYAGIFVASLLVGWLIDRFGSQLNLMASSLLVGLAMTSFALARSYVAASLAVVLLGFGGGGLNTSTNALVSDTYGERRGPMLNLLGIFFGIGAVLVPLLAAAIEGHFTVSQLFFFCASLAFACALLYALVSFPPAKRLEAGSIRESLSAIKFQGILPLAFILFFESGNEASIGGWVSTFANARGVSPRTASLVLAAYWAALMLSRILAARILRWLGKSQLVLACALLAAVSCAALLSVRSPSLLAMGTALIGFAFGPIFPTSLAVAGDCYPEAAGTIFGLLFSIALVGGMSFPWLVGTLSERVALRAGMGVPCLGALGIFLLATMMVRRPLRSQKPDSISM
jgi:fucose permease